MSDFEKGDRLYSYEGIDLIEWEFLMENPLNPRYKILVKVSINDKTDQISNTVKQIHYKDLKYDGVFHYPIAYTKEGALKKYKKMLADKQEYAESRLN